jgi:hypothetical protein
MTPLFQDQRQLGEQLFQVSSSTRSFSLLVSYAFMPPTLFHECRDEDSLISSASKTAATSFPALSIASASHNFRTLRTVALRPLRHPNFHCPMGLRPS